MKLRKFKHPPLFLVTYWNFIYSLVIFFLYIFLKKRRLFVGQFEKNRHKEKCRYTWFKGGKHQYSRIFLMKKIHDYL